MLREFFHGPTAMANKACRRMSAAFQLSAFFLRRVLKILSCLFLLCKHFYFGSASAPGRAFVSRVTAHDLVSAD